MGLIKRRPEISVVTSPEITAGQDVAGEVILEASEAVPIDWIEVRLVGQEQGAVGAGQSRSSKEVELVNGHVRVAGEGELEAGEHRFAFALPTSEHLPPSYVGANASSRYHLEVHVSIPWWPDAKKRYEIYLRTPAPAAEHPGEPVLLSSRPEGPEGTKPHVEISLAQSVLAPGDTLRGAVALSNVEHHRYHRVLFELRTVEDVVLGRFTRSTNRNRQFRYVIDISEIGEGEQHEFSLGLPGSLPPTYASHLWSLTWELRIVVAIRWALDLKFDISVPVVEHRFRKPARGRIAPAVGSPRVEAAWSAVADELGLELVGSSLRGSFEGAALRIEREHRGADGLHLVGAVTYPDLHLDLSIAPGSGLFGRTARQGLQLGSPGFDERHEIQCRDQDQARALLEPLEEALAEIGALSMDDEALVAEAESAGTVAAELREFATPLVTVAKSIARARRQIPPPAAAAASVPIWQDLAAKLDGELDPSSMIVTGRFRGRKVVIETTWTPDGSPAEIATTVWLAAPVDEAVTGQLRPALVMDSLPDGIGDGARPLLESLAGLVELVRVGRDRIAAATEWLAQPHDALSLVRTLAEIGEVLSPGAGPYR